MAFQIKDFASITASIVNLMRSTTKKITDFNVGSVARTLIEAPAAEMDELYQQMLIGLREAIPVSVYNSFDFQRRPASPASGLIRVTVSSAAVPLLVPSGTSFSVTGGSSSYLSTEDVTIPAGATFIDVPVAAAVPGSAGNLPSGSAFTPDGGIDRFVSASNLSAFVSGFDEETDDERKLRFNAYISSLARGTNAAIRYGLSLSSVYDANGNEIERVVSSSIIEPWLSDANQPVALVRCYIHNGVGGTSAALVSRAREVIYGYYDANGNAVPGWKAAGVNVEVYAAIEQAVNVTGVLTAAAGYSKPDLVAQAAQQVYSYLQGLEIGAAAIRSEIIAIVMGIDGVTNFVMSAPSGDVAPSSVGKLMPGSINIT